MTDDCLQAISAAFNNIRTTASTDNQAVVETEPLHEVILSNSLLEMIANQEASHNDITRYLEDAPDDLWVNEKGALSIFIDGFKMRQFLRRL